MATAVATLGELLFANTALSGDGKHSCANCHNLGTNGADNRKLRIVTSNGGFPLTTLSVFNAVLNYRLGWQGRFRTLEEQAASSLLDSCEMGTSRAGAIQAVEQDPALQARFREVFGRAVDWDGLIVAIVSFERTLLTPGSRFDRWLAGDVTALSEQEQKGFQRFKAFGCISCHQGVNVGGNLLERSGVF